MIIAALCTPIFWLIDIIIGMLPVTFSLPNWLDPCISLIQTALWFFPSDVWITIMGNVVFWQFSLLLWSFIEWCYKKVPGIK